MDIGGPYVQGVPVTDRPVARHQWPRYMLVGAFVPFGEKEAKARYDQEVKDRHAANLEGPVMLETTTMPNSRTLYFVELLPAKSDAPQGVIRMVNRIENQHKCKAVYRIHADRAQELTGDRARQAFENRGITVTSTAGYDSNANGRAERAVRYFTEKVRTLLSSKIRSEKFQERLQQLWTYAAQHAGDVHRREMFGEPRCKYEFGQCILSRVKEPATKFDPRMQRVIFLGFAPNVTNGFWVMRSDNKVELTSNIADETVFDEAVELPQRKMNR